MSSDHNEAEIEPCSGRNGRGSSIPVLNGGCGHVFVWGMGPREDTDDTHPRSAVGQTIRKRPAWSPR